MKRVTIFTCIGGHNTISNALQQHLSPFYDVTVKNIFLDVFKPIDFIRTFSFGRYTTEDLYSIVLKKRWHRFMNIFLQTIGYPFFRLRNKKMYQLISNCIVNDQPDLIISVIPFFNHHFLTICKKLNIPFVLVPTDIDISTFLYQITPELASYVSFHVALPFDTHTTKHNLLSYGIHKKNIHVTGVALKSSFFEQHNPDVTRKKFNIPHNRPVILLLMGSQGSTSLYNFAQQLSFIATLPLHLVMVLGRNNKQKCMIDTIHFPQTITTSLFAFTPHISELMSISNLLITKSGGVSVCEALYMNLPMLLDATHEVLLWERMNQQFVIHNKFGEIVTDIKNLPDRIRQLLSHTNSDLSMYKNNLSHFEKKNGGTHINQLLDSLFQNDTQKE